MSEDDTNKIESEDEGIQEPTQEENQEENLTSQQSQESENETQEAAQEEQQETSQEETQDESNRVVDSEELSSSEDEYAQIVEDVSSQGLSSEGSGVEKLSQKQDTTNQPQQTNTQKDSVCLKVLDLGTELIAKLNNTDEYIEYNTTIRPVLAKLHKVVSNCPEREIVNQAESMIIKIQSLIIRRKHNKTKIKTGGVKESKKGLAKAFSSNQRGGGLVSAVRSVGGRLVSSKGMLTMYGGYAGGQLAGSNVLSNSSNQQLTPHFTSLTPLTVGNKRIKPTTLVYELYDAIAETKFGRDYRQLTPAQKAAVKNEARSSGALNELYREIRDGKIDSSDSLAGVLTRRIKERVSTYKSTGIHSTLDTQGDLAFEKLFASGESNTRNGKWNTKRSRGGRASEEEQAEQRSQGAANSNLSVGGFGFEDGVPFAPKPTKSNKSKAAGFNVDISVLVGKEGKSEQKKESVAPLAPTPKERSNTHTLPFSVTSASKSAKKPKRLPLKVSKRRKKSGKSKKASSQSSVPLAPRGGLFSSSFPFKYK